MKPVTTVYIWQYIISYLHLFSSSAKIHDYVFILQPKSQKRNT